MLCVDFAPSLELPHAAPLPPLLNLSHELTQPTHADTHDERLSEKQICTSSDQLEFRKFKRGTNIRR
jgi:hypothetical protein